VKNRFQSLPFKRSLQRYVVDLRAKTVRYYDSLLDNDQPLTEDLLRWSSAH
jgi:hypothetical protein